MKQHYDTIIIGGGVIGSSIAFQLSKRNQRVLVVERDKLAGKASSAAAGMLGAQAEMEGDFPLSPIAKKSREMFPGLAGELKYYSGTDIELIQGGILKVAQTEEEALKLQSIGTVQRSLGEEAEWLSRTSVKKQEPALSENCSGGLFFPDDGQVNPKRLSNAFAHSAAVLGADFLEYTEVQNMVVENKRVVGVQTVLKTIFADDVVVAAGAWSNQILEKAGASLNTYPVKGECFSVWCNGQTVISSIFSTSCYIVPKAGGRLIIGATQKPNTFDETVQIESLSRLMSEAIQIIPALKKATWEKAWAGIRPQTGDDLPYIGRHPYLKGLSIATGHYRNGILLSPITGILAADLIEGKEGYNLFRIGRAKEGVT